MQFLEATFYFQLQQNMGYVPCVVQHILVAYGTLNSLYLPSPAPKLRRPLPTGNHVCSYLYL